MSLDIVISSSSDKPIYQQLFEQLSSQIIKGQAAEGYCLPPIRTVAKELQISVNNGKKGMGGIGTQRLNTLNGWPGVLRCSAEQF
jgi:GntR family transcriptional regulator